MRCGASFRRAGILPPPAPRTDTRCIASTSSRSSFVRFARHCSPRPQERFLGRGPSRRARRVASRVTGRVSGCSERKREDLAGDTAGPHATMNYVRLCVSAAFGAAPRARRCNPRVFCAGSRATLSRGRARRWPSGQLRRMPLRRADQSTAARSSRVRARLVCARARALSLGSARASLACAPRGVSAALHFEPGTHALAVRQAAGQCPRSRAARSRVQGDYPLVAFHTRSSALGTTLSWRFVRTAERRAQRPRVRTPRRLPPFARARLRLRARAAPTPQTKSPRVNSRGDSGRRAAARRRG